MSTEREPNLTDEVLASLHGIHDELATSVTAEGNALNAELPRYQSESWRQDPQFMYRLGKYNEGDRVVKMLHAVLVRFGDERAGRTLDPQRVAQLTEE